ncbi:MAG: hypothetical protein IAF94_04630, partial [Pirellulaceae bacterium]|nr:hypothetical protein [Pirellulaceae bacterium]
MDFTASIVAATGAALPAGRNLDGIDLFPVLRGQKPAVERTLFWRIERGDRKQKAARRGPWKLVRDGAIDQLFDLSQDPGERVDLAMKHPKIAGNLRTAIAEWEAEMDKDYPKLSVK